MIFTDNVHLISNKDLKELHSFAESIELNRCWFEPKKEKRRPHYDLVNKYKKPLYDKNGEKFMDKATRFGALKITSKELVTILNSGI